MRRMFLWFAAVGLCAPAWADPTQAADRVDEGLRRFRAGQYVEAAREFAEAGKALPDDPRIAFDRGCALAAQGDPVAALDELHKAALARDPALAARARFNLGATELASARKTFGEKPEEAAPDARKTGLEALARAIGHYRTLVRDPGVPAEVAADARHDLELIRLWIKHMTALWEERDRQKQRQEMGLVEFLEMLRARQLGLRAAARLLEPEPDSPHRREAVAALAKGQRTLAEEIAPLKQKIEAALQGAGEEALKALSARADAAGSQMGSAAEQLDAGRLADARAAQTGAAAVLEEILLAVVTFPELVPKGVQTQRQVLDATTALAEAPAEEHRAGLEDLAGEQERLEHWAQALPAKAQQAKQAAEGFDPSKLPPSPGGGGPAPDPEAAKKQMEALAKAAARAIELAPRLQDLSREAHGALVDARPGDARPKQEEALKLWKEIADLLPKQEQQQQQDQQQNDQDQEKKDPQEQKDKDADKQEQKDKDKDAQKQPKPEQGQDPKKQPMTPEQAEALLRKARERERKHKEETKELLEGIAVPGGVEKDW